MTHYAPCFGCSADKHTCPRRQEIRKIVAGNGITSIKFTCPNRKPLFVPGDRVTVTLHLSEEYERWEEEFPATVLSEVRNGKFVVKAESTDDFSVAELMSNGYCKVPAGRLKALNEPRRSVCGVCWAQIGVNEKDRCFSVGSWLNPKCLAKNGAPA